MLQADVTQGLVAECEAYVVFTCYDEGALRIPREQRPGRRQKVSTVDRHGHRDSERSMNTCCGAVTFCYPDLMTISPPPRMCERPTLRAPRNGSFSPLRLMN